MAVGLFGVLVGVSCQPNATNNQDLANSDLGTQDIATAAGCVTTMACADSVKDCQPGERCNKGLTPPRCQMIYCGVAGSPCDGQDELCQAGLVCSTVCSTAPS